MAEFVVTLGSLSAKLTAKRALLFGANPRFHFTSFAAAIAGWMKPHVTPDFPGGKKIWFRYRPKFFREVFDRLSDALVRMELARLVPVQLSSLNDDWIATFIPDEVADAYFEKHKKAGRLDLTLELMAEIFDLALAHPCEVSTLDALVDAAPGDRRRRGFSLLRVDETDEIEHAFLVWREGPDGVRQWFFRRPGPVDEAEIERVFREVLPVKFFQALETINRKVGLGLDPDRLRDFVR